MHPILDFILHVVMCSGICMGIHFIFHRRIDDKNHDHLHCEPESKPLDISLLADQVADIIELRRMLKVWDDSLVSKKEMYERLGLESYSVNPKVSVAPSGEQSVDLNYKKIIE